jgi:hypothetical protein
MTKPKRRVRRPSMFVVDDGLEHVYADFDGPDRIRISAVTWASLNIKETRKLAAWLTRAVDYLEQQRTTEQGRE